MRFIGTLLDSEGFVEAESLSEMTCERLPALYKPAGDSSRGGPTPDNSFDPIDAEPSTITDFNGFVGLAYINGTVTRTNTKTHEVRVLPTLFSDMRFMSGVYRGVDNRLHQGAFALI